MKLRILLSLCALLLVSAGAANAAPKPKLGTASQQLCESLNGTYSTKASTSFFRPFYKKQGVLWTCNGYTGGSASSQALHDSCLANIGQWADTNDAGFATCWKNPPL